MLTSSNPIIDQRTYCTSKTGQSTKNFITKSNIPRSHRLGYYSSYDRGLHHLLMMWEDIKCVIPDATLDIAYGWDLFDRVAHNNPERMQWKELMVGLMQQDGITEHGRLGKLELTKLRQSCGIWAYPTEFTEINCITALEAQHDGLVPVTIALAALKETVGSGVLVHGDIYDLETKEEYLKQLIDLMKDHKRWKKESSKARKFSSNYGWDKIANKWDREFIQDDQSIKVTVYTPTIRKGFWNIMASNLAKQTYKNFEWLVIDDNQEDRSKTLAETAKKYGITARYAKGKERAIKRTYGLVNANNTALQMAKGELLVFLQDFVLMPEDGLEQLVTLYKKNPDALIAPVDMYVAPKIKPDIESEDWFDGKTDVIGDFIRQNVRIQNKGLRETKNPYDFEQNYGAIPVKIAKELGGWYEFYDEGLGYDNTDISLRALLKGYRILLDETNVAICIDHWEALSGTRENVIGRARKLNDPRYIWAQEMMNNNKLPIVRTQEIDDKIELLYDIPVAVKDEKVVAWVQENAPLLVEKWLKEIFI